MALYYLIILALIQGITEFLPISSSGHLVLVHEFMNGETEARWQENLMLDVAVHVGTLLSVLIYFRKDVCKMLAGLKDWATGKCDSDGARLDLYVVVSSLPVIAAGFVLHKLEPSWIRSIEVMAWATLIFGALLWWIDRVKPPQKTLTDMSLRDAFWIGCAQALALVPGTSRSGITMTAARWFGFSRTESAHYSLLLAIIAISGAGTLGALDLFESGDVALTLDVLLAAALAFVAGWTAIAVMMRWLEKATFKVFAVYRIILGVVLLALIYSGFAG